MDKNKWVVAALIAVGALVALVAVLPKTKQSSTAANITPPTVTRITAEEVASHDSRDDCWTVINGKVYNITGFISSHPGGDEILRACGIDATSLFTQRETSSGQPVGSGTPHSSSAASQLASLQIGVLSSN